MYYITQPMVLSRTPAQVVTTAPTWGEHTEEVLNELGYSSAEIQSFRDNKVV